MIVDVALSALGVTAGDFWNSLWSAANRVYAWGVSAFGWTWDYILIGAAIVLPVVIVSFVWRSIRARRAMQKNFSRRLENRISSAAMDIQHFISRAQLSLTSEPADTNPDLHPDEVPEGCDHYTCALRGRTLGMTFHFTCPRGEGPPLIKDTVRYLGAVAAELESCDDLTDWADEYGFDAGHMDTRGAYDAIARLTRDLWQMIGDDLYDELRRDVEIEQAVDMAWAGFESSGRS